MSVSDTLLHNIVHESISKSAKSKVRFSYSIIVIKY